MGAHLLKTLTSIITGSESDDILLKTVDKSAFVTKLITCVKGAREVGEDNKTMKDYELGESSIEWNTIRRPGKMYNRLYTKWESVKDVYSKAKGEIKQADASAAGDAAADAAGT